MIEVVLEFILILFISSVIIIPIFFNILKEKIWDYINEKLKEQERHEQLKRDMKQRKKGNQGKTILK